MDKYELRKNKLFDVFETYYRSQIDDFYDSRDTFLREFEEIFEEHYNVATNIMALDKLSDINCKRQVKQLLKDFCDKLH